MQQSTRPEATHEEGPIAYLLETLTESLRYDDVAFIVAIQDKRTGRVFTHSNTPKDTCTGIYSALLDLGQAS